MAFTRMGAQRLAASSIGFFSKPAVKEGVCLTLATAAQIGAQVYLNKQYETYASSSPQIMTREAEVIKLSFSK